MQNGVGKMQIKTLEKTIKLLGCFALNREVTVEQAAEAIKRDYTTALRMMKHLEKAHLIKLNRLERTSPKGKEKRYYRITLYGLESFLNYCSVKGTLQNIIRQVAQVHSDMLLSFAKWDKIEAAGCEKLCLRNLKIALRAATFARYEFPLILSTPLPFPEEDENQRKAFDCTVLGIIHCTIPLDFVKEGLAKEGFGEKDLLELCRLIENDYELRRLRDWYCFMKETEAKDMLKSIGEWREFFKRLAMEAVKP